MYGYDYSFCISEGCSREDCIRHKKWMPKEVPVTVSDFKQSWDENGNCEFYYSGKPAREPINLNTATEEDLRDLGLTKTKVKNILLAREHKGGFRSVVDLRDVRGIGDVVFNRVANLLYVEKQQKEEAVPVLDKQQLEWMLWVTDATKVMTEFLDKTFPNLWCNLRFEHVDAAAYWYTFELKNDKRRQTWSIRHSEVQKGE